MIRVLHYIPGFLYGGVETLFLQWYENIDKSEFELELLKRTQDNDSEILKQYVRLGGKYYTLSSLKMRKINEFRIGVKNFFRDHNDYDILHMHGSDPFVMHYAKKYDIAKIIVHSHTTKLDKGTKAMMNRIDEQIAMRLYADAFWACSKKAADWKFKGIKRDSKSFKIVHNSINWEKCLYNEEVRKRIRKSWGLEKKFVVGTVGRITTPKNPDGIIEIFSGVKRKRKDARLLWIGDGPDLEEIKKKVNELDLSETIIFTGYREDIAELMQAMDVFILPSLWEGLPLTALEAQAAGLRTLCSQCVTTEVDVTPWCKHISLDSIEDWTEEICKFERNKRNDASEYFKNSIYAFSYGLKELEAGYRQILKNGLF